MNFQVIESKPNKPKIDFFLIKSKIKKKNIFLKLKLLQFKCVTILDVLFGIIFKIKYKYLF